MSPTEQVRPERYCGSILQDDFFLGQTERFDKSFSPETSIRFYEPGEIVIHNDEPSGHIYTLHSGQAVIYMGKVPQNETISYPVERGRLYGVIEALAGDRSYFEMKALTHCEFGFVSRDNFLARVIRDPAMCFRLAQILSRMNRQILLSVTLG